MEMSPDKMVQDLLKILRERGVAALVVYASRAARGVPVRIVSNSDQRGAQGILSWLMKIEPAARDAAARAIHDATTGLDLVDNAADPAEAASALRPCLVCGTIEPWDGLGPVDKDRHVQVANVAIAAIKANTGRAPQAEMLPQ